MVAASATALTPRLAALLPSRSTLEAAPAHPEIIIEPESASTPSITEQRTPLLARYGDIVVRLPVRTDTLSEILFHQASFRWALPLTTPLPDADVARARERRTTDRPFQETLGEDAVLEGSVLRLWREGQPGEPDTAIDVGSPEGATVVSPVDGTVVLVRPYKLYDTWDDIEIHIRPTGRRDLDVVLLHTSDPVVQAGDVVVGGLTEVSRIRRLDDKMPLQLRTYVPLEEGGNHVHVQVNDATYPGYHGLDGAITLPGDPPRPSETTPTP